MFAVEITKNMQECSPTCILSPKRHRRCSSSKKTRSHVYSVTLSTDMNKKRLVIKRHTSLLEIFEMVNGTEISDVQMEIDDNTALKNYLNLTLLLYRFPAKRFSFITSSSELKKLGEPLGIKFFQKNDDIEFEREYAKKHILAHNFTFFEYGKYEMQKLISKLAFL